MTKCRKKKQKRTSEKWTFKKIVQDSDNWERYQQEYAEQVTEHQVSEVEKMLGCRDAKNGFATYICMNCGEQEQVPFSCKSRICSSCGKVHAEEWAKQLSSRMFNVVHRHITFTIPDVLWSEFEREAGWRGILFQAASATLRKVMGLECGVVAVLHPYGKDLKVNYHVHVLVSEGGLDEGGLRLTPLSRPRIDQNKRNSYDAIGQERPAKCTSAGVWYDRLWCGRSWL